MRAAELMKDHVWGSITCQGHACSYIVVLVMTTGIIICTNASQSTKASENLVGLLTAASRSAVSLRPTPSATLTFVPGCTGAHQDNAEFPSVLCMAGSGLALALCVAPSGGKRSIGSWSILISLYHQDIKQKWV